MSLKTTLSYGSALFLSLVGPTHADWVPLAGAPFQPGRLEDVFFVTDDVGWTIYFGGHFYRTENGGATWEDVPNVPFALYRTLCAVSPSHGWIGTLSAGTPLLETTDGGDTWSSVSALEGVVPGLCGMWVVDEQTVYAVGKVSGPATIVKTTNAGADWIVTDFADRALGLIDCVFFSPDSGIAVGYGPPDGTRRAAVYGTNDGGQTWETRHVGSRIDEWCWKVSFPSRQIGYASIERFDNEQWILKTTDGGQTWTEIHIGTTLEQQGIGFLDDLTGWVGGRGSLEGDPGYTQRTTDGGTTWEEDPWGVNVNAFCRSPGGDAYAAGQTIYRYLNPTDVPGDTDLTETVLYTSRNPFGDAVALRYHRATNGPSRLVVLSAAGEQVALLVNRFESVGPHEAVWTPDPSSVPSGIYFAVLEVSEGTYVRKLHLLR
ncbi:MAG: hypothetical protein R3E12_03935 [Candidatus Eisenbacteria bacterium]|uniref:Photosynthesis system II assembly factor Ycf48/Hcf136-like domain-containing protein n=1 Tax=Eiseniibacteriota bacterium TaxID=2212470 RepID=A0A956RQJ3_UNCEI|nr:hypothetical protein [Candidatus Eisenbacteria bacterium]